MSRKKKHAHVNHERWMVSYADFVTLLFAFFVVMFASSRHDPQKAQEAGASIRTAFQTMGAFPDVAERRSSGKVAQITPKIVPAGEADASREDLHRLKHRMDQVLAPQIADGTVTVTIGREGLLISLLDAGFFESGSAIPKTASILILNRIGTVIAAAPYDVRIEGHTDNVPIHNAVYASNWELSTARASVLTRLFIEKDRVLPERLSAAGYAQYHPVASNRTAAGRSRNRRVDIIVLPTREMPATSEPVGPKGTPLPYPSVRDAQRLRRIQSAAIKPTAPPMPPTLSRPVQLATTPQGAAPPKQKFIARELEKWKSQVQMLYARVK